MSKDLAATHTLVELAKRHRNKIALDIAHSIQWNPIIQDAQWFEANGLDSNVHTKAASIPTASVYLVNKGLEATTATTQQVTEPIIDIGDRVELDDTLVQRASNPSQYRYEEDMLHLEGLSRKFMSEFFYGDRSDVIGDLNGLATRYNDPTDSNVLDEGSTTDNACTSIWVIRWGKNGVFLSYPKNDKTFGLERNDEGKELITTTGNYRAYFRVSTFKMKFALNVRKDAAAQRLGSIDDTDAVDEDNLLEMLANIQEEYGDFKNTVMYCNTRAWKQLAIAAKDAGNTWHPSETPFGTWQWDFMGVPVKICGGLKDTEDDI